MKTKIAMLACSLLLVLGAVSGSATSNDEMRVDAENLNMNGLEMVDADLEDLTKGLTVPAGSLIGNDAGCDGSAGGSHWAQAGTPSGPCTGSDIHNFGISYTSISCLEDCYADALDWPTFGFVFVSCAGGSTALIDWTTGAGYVLAGDCSATVSGNPTGFSNWDSLSNSAKFSHTDNLGDALVHLVA